jgi:hypothetical protein
MVGHFTPSILSDRIFEVNAINSAPMVCSRLIGSL